jgi:hypothetical protein
MARGKYGAGRATGGDEYDLIDIGYVPTASTGTSISKFVDPSTDDEPGEPGVGRENDDADTTAAEARETSTKTGYSASVPLWRRRLADAISPRPQPTGSTGTARTAGGATTTAKTAPTARSSAQSSRPAAGAARAGSAATSGGTTARTRQTADIIYGLDRREQIVSAVAACLAIAFAIVIGIVGAHPAKTSKNHQTINSLVLMAVFGLPAVAMLVGVIVRRRALVGFTALLTGFAFFAFGVFYAVVYFVLGGWLIFRVFKYNKQLAPEKQSSRPGSAQTTAATTSAKSVKTGAGANSSSSGSRAASTAGKSPDSETAAAPRRRWWSGTEKEVEPSTRPRPSRRDAAAAARARTAATSKRYTPPRPASSQRKGTATH